MPPLMECVFKPALRCMGTHMRCASAPLTSSCQPRPRYGPPLPFPPLALRASPPALKKTVFPGALLDKGPLSKPKGVGRRAQDRAVAQEGMAGGHKEPFFLLQALLGSTLMCFPAALGGSSPFRPNIVLTEEREGGQIQHTNCFRIKNKQVSIERQESLAETSPSQHASFKASEKCC